MPEPFIVEVNDAPDAYQLARRGTSTTPPFEGTRDEWLASLASTVPGPPGDTSAAEALAQEAAGSAASAHALVDAAAQQVAEAQQAAANAQLVVEEGHDFIVRTKADLPAGTNTGDKAQRALVWQDPAPSNNGTYVKAMAASAWEPATGDGLGRLLRVESRTAGLRQEGADFFSIRDEEGNAAVKVDGTKTSLKNLGVSGILDILGVIDALNADVAFRANALASGRTPLVVIADEAGNVIRGFDADGGSLSESGALFEDDALRILAVDDVGLASGRTPSIFVTDETGSVSEVLVGEGEGATQPQTRSESVSLPADVLYIPFYGQSLTIGWNSLPPISVQKYNLLMFSEGGTYPAQSGIAAENWFLNFTKLEETANASPTLGETPLTGALEQIKDMLFAEAGIDPLDDFYQLLASGLAIGGWTAAQLAKGTQSYADLIRSVEAAVSIANAAGKTSAVPGWSYTQGEGDYAQDTDPETWRATVRQMHTDFQDDVVAATGQTFRPVLAMYQNSAHQAYNRGVGAPPTIGLMQLDLALHEDDVVMSTPIYFMEFTDAVHLTNVSSKWLGAYIGLALYRAAIRDRLRVKAGVEVPKWLPVHVVETLRQGNIATLQFHVPSPPLVADTSWVTDPGNLGFDKIVAPGNVDIAVTGVELLGPSTLRITAASTIPAGSKLHYGWYGASAVSGRASGPRGCIRDSQGDYLRMDPHGLNRPLHNWLPICEIAL